EHRQRLLAAGAERDDPREHLEHVPLVEVDARTLQRPAGTLAVVADRDRVEDRARHTNRARRSSGMRWGRPVVSDRNAQIDDARATTWSPRRSSVLRTTETCFHESTQVSAVTSWPSVTDWM